MSCSAGRRGLADRRAPAAGFGVAVPSYRGQQFAGAGPGVRDHRRIHRQPVHFRRIDVDANRFQTIGPERPAERGRQFHAGADADHEIGVRPQPVRRGHCQPQFMGVADDAAPAAERHHRRVDQFGKLEDFIARIDGAAADEDHRRLAVVRSVRRRP